VTRDTDARVTHPTKHLPARQPPSSPSHDWWEEREKERKERERVTRDRDGTNQHQPQSSPPRSCCGRSGREGE
jgi:hypothetical protein